MVTPFADGIDVTRYFLCCPPILFFILSHFVTPAPSAQFCIAFGSSQVRFLSPVNSFSSCKLLVKGWEIISLFR